MFDFIIFPLYKIKFHGFATRYLLIVTTKSQLKKPGRYVFIQNIVPSMLINTIK